MYTGCVQYHLNIEYSYFSHLGLKAEDCDKETDCYCDAQTHHYRLGVIETIKNKKQVKVIKIILSYSKQNSFIYVCITDHKQHLTNPKYSTLLHKYIQSGEGRGESLKNVCKIKNETRQSHKTKKAYLDNIPVM